MGGGYVSSCLFQQLSTVRKKGPHFTFYRAYIGYPRCDSLWPVNLCSNRNSEITQSVLKKPHKRNVFLSANMNNFTFYTDHAGEE